MPRGLRGGLHQESFRCALGVRGWTASPMAQPVTTCARTHRRGHDDLGDHYLDCGDLSNALKCYSRARDYCTSAKHVINMCLNVIKVGPGWVAMGQQCQWTRKGRPG